MTPCPLCQFAEVYPFHHSNVRTYYRCPVCHLTFVLPDSHPHSREEKARYITHRNDPSDSNYRAFLSRLTDHLIPKLNKGAQGLDYGSGPGPALPVMMEEKGFIMHTYDPFFAPLPHALEKRYDFVTCTEVVEHFHHPRAEFARFVLLLGEGGYLGVMTEMPGDDSTFPDWYYHRDPTHVCFYKKETFEWIAQWLGWNVEFPAKNIAIFISAS